MADVTVWLRSPGGVRLAVLVPTWAATSGYRFAALRYRRALNEVTELVMRMPLAAAPTASFFALDARLEVWIDGRLDTETQWFVRVPPHVETDEAGQQFMVVRASCALYLVQGRIVAYADGSLQTDKSGPSDDLIKEYVGENLGAGALADRNLSAWLTLDDPLGLAATVQKVAPRRNLLLVCQELARASAQAGVALFFDVVWNGQQLQFRTYAGMRGRDRSRGAARLVLGPGWGTLDAAAQRADHRDELTVVYTSDAGNLLAVSDDDRRGASPFNRREQYVSSPADSGGAEADSPLFRGRPRTSLTGSLRSTSTVQYGRDWQWGDLVAVEGMAEPFAVHAVGVTIANGGMQATAELRSGSLDEDDPVRRIEAVLDQGNAGGTPGGGSSGTVTSVGLSLPALFTVTGSPVTTSGTLTASLVTQSANQVLAGPTSGAAAGPTFRSLVATDIPALDASTIATGTLDVLRVPNLDAAKIASGMLGLARLPVAASGALSTTQLVRADDVRLSDARTPLAHTHAFGELSGTLSDAQHGSRGGGVLHALASASAAGFMSAADYTKLAGVAAGAQPGTVTSVGLALPAIFTVSGAPVTTSGTLTAALAAQAAGTVLAGPTSGAAAAPTFRALVAADVPELDAAKIASGTLADGRLAATVARLHVAQSWTAVQSMRGAAANQPATFRMMPTGTPASYRSAFEFWRTDFDADSVNWERVFMVWDYGTAGLFQIRSEAAGTGVARPIALVGAPVLINKTSGLTGAGDVDAAGRVRAATFETAAGNRWALGGYTAGALSAVGWVSVTIDGVVRRVLIG